MPARAAPALPSFAGRPAGAVATLVTTPGVTYVGMWSTVKKVRPPCGGPAPGRAPRHSPWFCTNALAFSVAEPCVAVVYLCACPCACVCVCQVFADEGLAGFAKGMRARIMIHAPSMAISWTTYEVVKQFLVERY